MTPKKIFTFVLLLFVAGSVVHLVRNEISSADKAAANLPDRSATTNQGRESVSPENNQTAEARFVAYYFHGNVRCPTCRAIEAYGKEAVEAAFPDKLESGDLEWKAVNTDEVWNAHYMTDFNLQFSSLILAEQANGETLRWVNLEKVWELVHDKESFMDYVQSSAITFMTLEG
jgi:hypothetical protein